MPKGGLKINLKDAVVLTIVVSFITALLSGFIAGGLASQLLGTVQGKGGLNTASLSASALTQEQAVIKAVEKASPAVVSIIVSKDLPVIEQYYGSPFDDDSFFQRFFGNDFFSPFNLRTPQYRQKEETEKTEIGGGTGFIVSQDGFILTNRHVVSDEEADYTVLTNDGEEFAAEVLGRDPYQDIAILKIDKDELPVIELGNSDEIKIGQTVIAIGNALGEFRNTVSVGVISGLKRTVVATGDLGQSEELSEAIQTDTAINPGNSGGPLLDLSGRVIGINVAMVQDAENVGFAIPVNKAQTAVEQVKEKGKISYPFLGIRYVLINPQVQKESNLSVDYGALVVKGEGPDEPAVLPDSPADKAGIVENDIILEMNGEEINSENTLVDLIRKHQAGEEVSLKILHEGKEKTLRVKLGERN